MEKTDLWLQLKSWKTPTTYYLSRKADKEELQETEEQRLKPWTTPPPVYHSTVWTSHRVQGFLQLCVSNAKLSDVKISFGFCYGESV